MLSLLRSWLCRLRSRLVFLLLLSSVWSLLWAALAAAHSHHHTVSQSHETTGCGTGTPSLKSLARDQARLEHLLHKRHTDGRRREQLASCDKLEPQSIEIKTYFHFMAIPISGRPDLHLIPHPTEVAIARGEIDEYTTYEEMVVLCERQVELINYAFRETPFHYTFQANPSVSTNLNYTNYPLDHKAEMRKEHGVAGLQALNIYLSFSMGSEHMDTTGYLGLADFPSYQFEGDGIFMRYDVLPGGGLSGNDDGFIGTFRSI